MSFLAPAPRCTWRAAAASDMDGLRLSGALVQALVESDLGECPSSVDIG